MTDGPAAGGDEGWSEQGLADRFADQAYASAKGVVRTAVIDRQLREHLPAPPAPVLDVGGGAGHQSLPLAAAGHEVTILDPSAAMLAKARERLGRLAPPVGERVALVQADGLEAPTALAGREFPVVLCPGVLGYLDDPAPMLDRLCRCVAPGGLLSVMTANADAAAVRPALERRWADALAAFDEPTEVGVLGVPSRADTVSGLSALMRAGGVEPVAWYGVWLFVDWLDLAGTPLDAADREEMSRLVEVELEAGRRDPYRGLSRVFHLVGRRSGTESLESA